MLLLHPLQNTASTLPSQRYISQVLRLIVLLNFESLPTATFRKFQEWPRMTCIDQNFFAHQIAFLLWNPCSPDLSSIENVLSMIAVWLVRNTPPATTKDQLLWQTMRYLTASSVRTYRSPQYICRKPDFIYTKSHMEFIILNNDVLLKFT